mmetsp:Transcript_43027/g.31417  ORF Transcript_43027/g.31417 Transcript_43027/m.31417 type:complete len:128 (+) Transcript_43027:526-909(+)
MPLNGKLHNFIFLLQEILNPVNEEGMQLDSVQQLKRLVKGYYLKKDELLSSCRDKLAMMIIERPNLLELKKKHFLRQEGRSGEIQQALDRVRDLRTELEAMKLNAEVERLQKYKEKLMGMLGLDIGL